MSGAEGRGLAVHGPAVGNVLATIERRDWARLERLLDAGVQWCAMG